MFIHKLPHCALKFHPGLFLECLQDNADQPVNRWAIVDEINRADIDKAFGPLFSALTRQDVELPYDREGHRVQIIGNPKDGTEVNPHTFIVPEQFRIIATMNTFDKSSLYAMSYAFMRRFAFIPVDVPVSISEGLVTELAAIWGLTADKILAGLLANVWKSINEKRKIGPALLKDMYRYIAHSKASGTVDYAGAISMFVLPQLEGMERKAILDLVNRLMVVLDIIGEEAKALLGWASEFSAVEIDGLDLRSLTP